MPWPQNAAAVMNLCHHPLCPTQQTLNQDQHPWDSGTRIQPRSHLGRSLGRWAHGNLATVYLCCPPLTKSRARQIAAHPPEQFQGTVTAHTADVGSGLMFCCCEHQDRAQQVQNTLSMSLLQLWSVYIVCTLVIKCQCCLGRKLDGKGETNERVNIT